MFDGHGRQTGTHAPTDHPRPDRTRMGYCLTTPKLPCPIVSALPGWCLAFPPDADAWQTARKFQSARALMMRDSVYSVRPASWTENGTLGWPPLGTQLQCKSSNPQNRAWGHSRRLTRQETSEIASPCSVYARLLAAGRPEPVHFAR